MPFSLSHVELYLSDLKAARPFWLWFFEAMGFSVVSSWDEGICFGSNECYFCFVQARAPYQKEAYHRSRPGLNHLAFRADTAQEVISLRAQLLSRGVTLLYEDRYPHAASRHTHAVFFEGPERFKIEVVANL